MLVYRLCFIYYASSHLIFKPTIITLINRWENWVLTRLLLVQGHTAQKQAKSETVSCSVMSTLCDPIDCSPSGSCIHGVFQARILECIAIPFSRGSSQTRDWTQVSWIDRRTLYHCPSGKPPGWGTMSESWASHIFHFCAIFPCCGDVFILYL